MAAKILLFIAMYTASVVYGDNDCDCKNADTKAIWDFFIKLSEEAKSDIEDKDTYSVSPGLLSPLLDCNCLDDNRRKRDVDAVLEQTESEYNKNNMAVMKEKDEKVETVKQIDADIFTAYSKKGIRFGTRFCPKGYVKIGYMCITEVLLDDVVIS